MGEHVLHTVYWDDPGTDVYLYGSDIRFYKDRSVYFESLMMPAGMTIKKWMSSANYQRDRVEPSLPMLIPGREYVLRAFYYDEPAGSVFMRLDFYDQQQKKTGTFLPDKKQSTFQCPENTYSYTAELVQGGAERVHFYRFEIFPEADKLFYQITNPVDGRAILNLLVPSANGRSAAVFDEDIPKGLTDYMVLSPFGSDLTPKTLDAIMKRSAPPDSYDGLCVWFQDELRYQNMIRKGAQTPKQQFRLWKAAEDE